MLFDLLRVLSLALLAVGAATASPKPKVPKGFVTTSGTKFLLDGKDFYFAGSNAYYFPFGNVPRIPLRLWRPPANLSRRIKAMWSLGFRQPRKRA